jgi:hypothetical protein
LVLGFTIGGEKIVELPHRDELAGDTLLSSA